MSLQQLLSYADSNSWEMKAARSGLAAAREESTTANRSTLLPDIQFDASVGYLGDGYGWGRDSNYNFTVPIPHFSTHFGIEAQQVIYAGGATTAARHLAQLGVQMAELDHEQHRQDLHLKLVAHYLDLCRSLRQLEVFDSNIALAQRMIDDISIRREQGTALKNDLTRYELQLATLQMQRLVVENDMTIANRTIVSLSGLPEGTMLLPTDSLPSPDINLENPSSLPVEMASTKRDIATEELHKVRAAMLPYACLVAQDALNGPVTIDITPYNINYNYWFIGVALRYNLSSLWKSNHAVRAARQKQQQAAAEYQLVEEQMREAQIAAQIRLDEALRNHSIKQKNLQLATENYTLVADRYANDLALLIDMLDASNQKLAAELDLISSNLAVAYRKYMIQYLNGKL